MTAKARFPTSTRVCLVLACAVLAASSLASCAKYSATGSASVGEWTMYQMRPDHNAVLHARAEPSWSWSAGAQINGGLAIAGGRVFLDTFSRQAISLDIDTGKPIWKADTQNIVMSTPIVKQGIVVIGSGHNGRLGARLNDTPYAFAGDSRPAAIWGRPEGDKVYGFDAISGKLSWQFETVGENMPSGATVEDSLIFTNGDEHVYSLSVTSGKLKWRQESDGLGTMASTNAYQRNAIVSICSDAPYRCSTEAIRAADGKLIWRSDFGNSDSTPTIAEGKVFVSGLENKTVGRHSVVTIVAALDALTGKLLWRYKAARGLLTEVGSNERAIAGLYSEGTYYQALPTTDEFIALDARSGARKWVFRSQAPIKMSAVINDGKLYVGDTAGLLYVLDHRSGSLLGLRSFKNPFSVSPPVLYGGSVIVANWDTVYAIPVQRLIASHATDDAVAHGGT